MCPSDRAHSIKFENMYRIFDYLATDKTQRQSMQPSETSKVSVGIQFQKKKILKSPVKFPMVLTCWIG